MPNEKEGKSPRGSRPDPGWPKGPEAQTMTFKIELGVNRDLMDVLTRCRPGPGTPADNTLLESILQKLDNLRIQGETMAQDLNARLDAVDANATRTGQAVAAAAEHIRVLAERQLAGKLTDAEYDDASNRITGIADFLGTVATQLEGLGHGPTDPPPINPEDVPE